MKDTRMMIMFGLRRWDRIPSVNLLALFMLVAATALLSAGVPQPDAIVYGQILVNGSVVTQSDNVSVIARVSGVANPVGQFRMGQSATSNDHYVLRIRLESAVTGDPINNNAARVGQIARIYVKIGNGDEILAHAVPIAEIGQLFNANLQVSVLPANCVADLQVDLNDYNSFKGCMSGPDNPMNKGCDCADVDGDNDIDLRDFSWMQRGFTGTQP